ncbi:MAG: hypothetical protein JRN20_12145 [Nitrososphaerota archaeon]|nr:hypothetical protein [Nitrososphaerota archaeon]
MATVLEEERANDRTNDNAKTMTVISTPKNASPIIVPPRTEFEEQRVVFLINDEELNQETFDLAIDTAKKFAAELVLTYLVENEEVPEGYREYARAEGIPDYAAGYFNFLANSKLGGLGQRAQVEGLEWTTSLYFGNTRKAADFYSEDKRDIVIANRPPRKSAFERFLDRLL